MNPASDSTRPALAFLGPVGTFSHQAAYECFGPSVEYVPQHTIGDVFQSLSPHLPFGVVPQENNTNGSVVETYNSLRDSAIGHDNFIRGYIVLTVSHCLVIRRGVKLEDIKHVLSHEQALGQCRSFLALHLPRASLVPTDSTASAAEEIATGTGAFDPYTCAAICSSIIVTIYKNLEVLQEGIQDGEGNSTRFFILTNGSDRGFPPDRIPPAQRQALIRIDGLAGNQTTRKSKRVDIRRVIDTLDLDILRIDRRPALHVSTFQDIYFLEVGDMGSDDENGALPWLEKFSQAKGRLEAAGVESTLLGHW
ncbi:Prephenate dehydratase-domain-containing protein [Scleroderma yunnanense]